MLRMRKVEKWKVNEVNENGQYFVDICAERGLFLTNTLQHVVIQGGKRE